MAPRKAAASAPKLSKKRRPNILYVMFDQLAPQFLPSYGHRVVKAPNLSRLAAGESSSTAPTPTRRSARQDAFP
jgi:arylsulfatase A-like enzyme